MPSFYVKVKGVREVEAALDAVAKRMDVAMARVAIKSAQIIEKKAKQEFRGDSSQPPQPPQPTRRTGNLRNSIHSDGPNSEGNSTYSAKVGPTLIYGRRVELGYEGGGRGRGHAPTRKFPYMAPAYEKSRDEITSLYQSEVRKAVMG